MTGALSPAEQDQLAALLEKMLRQVTASMTDAVRICRLCDEVVCPEGNCPVHQAALQRATEPPRA